MNFYHPSPFERDIILKKTTDMSRTIVTSKMDPFVALVVSFEPLTHFIKNPNKGVMGVLNSPPELF